MTTLQSWIDDVSNALEDYGSTITDQFTGDGVTAIWKTSSPPIKYQTESITVNSVLKTRGTDYTVNYDNGEVTFINIPANATTVIIQYTKVQWRDERKISAIQSGIRELYPSVYIPRECYVLVQNLKYDYDLTTSTDVPDNFASTNPTLSLPANYSAAQARSDFADSRTSIGWAEGIPFGANQIFTPLENFHRTTFNVIHFDLPMVPNSVVKLVYAGPPKLLVNVSDVSDVPDTFYDLPVWYALSVLMEKKEAPRSRFDAMASMQNTQAVPPGTQAQTAEDFLRRFYDTLAKNAMRPMRKRARRELRSYQYYQRF
jgi:hypothetical protein